MPQTQSARTGGPTLKDLMDAYESTLIGAALAATRGNQRQAAFRLGVLPTTLHEKMKRLGMVNGRARASRPAPAESEPATGEAAIF